MSSASFSAGSEARNGCSHLVRVEARFAHEIGWGETAEPGEPRDRQRARFRRIRPQLFNLLNRFDVSPSHFRRGGLHDLPAAEGVFSGRIPQYKRLTPNRRDMLREEELR